MSSNQSIMITNDALAAAIHLERARGKSREAQLNALSHVRDILNVSKIQNSCSEKHRNKLTGKLENLYAVPAARAAEVLKKYRNAPMYSGKSEADFEKFYPVTRVENGEAIREPVVSPEGLCMVNPAEAMEELLSIEATAARADEMLQSLDIERLKKTYESSSSMKNFAVSKVSKKNLKELQELDRLKLMGAARALMKPSPRNECDPRSIHGWSEPGMSNPIGTPNDPKHEAYVRPEKYERDANQYYRGFKMPTTKDADEDNMYCASAADRDVRAYRRGDVPMYPGVGEFMENVYTNKEQYSIWGDVPDETVQTAYQCAPLDSENDCTRPSPMRSPLGGQYTPADECKWRQDPRTTVNKNICVPNSVHDQIHHIEATHGSNKATVKSVVKDDALVDWYLNTLMGKERVNAGKAHKYTQQHANSENENVQRNIVELRNRYGHASASVKDPRLGAFADDEGRMPSTREMTARGFRGGGSEGSRSVRGGGGSLYDEPVPKYAV